MTLVMAALATLVVAANGESALNRGRDLRCGSYCLYVGLKALGLPVSDHEQLEKRLGQPTPQGYSMEDLATAARSFGAHAEGVRTSLEDLTRRRSPFVCIARLEKPGHFLLIRDVDSDRVELIDPPNQRTAPRDVFQSLWSGEALLISDKPLVMRAAWWSYAPAASLALGAAVLVGWWLRRSRWGKALAGVALMAAIGGCEGRSSEPKQPRAPVLPLIHGARPTRPKPSELKQPRASVSPLAVELGELPASSDKSTRASFDLENRGTSPLHVLDYTTTCGCTLVAVARSELLPGERLAIPFTVAPGLSGGPRESRAILTTDDPVTPRIEVPIRWTNLVPLSAEPPAVDFGAIRPGSQATTDVRIRLQADADGELLVRCTEPRITWQWTEDSKTSPINATRTLRVALKESSESAPGNGILSIRTRTGYEVDLPIQWRVMAPLSANPAAFFVSGADAQSELKRSILVTSGDSAEFRITNVTVNGRPAQAPDGRAARLHVLPVTLPRPGSPGIHRLEVVISTDLEGAAPLIVPCTVVAR